MEASGEVVVEEATEASDELLGALRRLLPQLSGSAPRLEADDLAELVAAPGTALLVARDAGRIVGAMTLVTFRIPTGLRAWIEDVVVDEAARGRGVGAALNTRALDIARQRGCRSVDLTSRPSREAANRLYQRLGFELRQTNLYRFALDA